jgi:hypothetical protein
MAEELDWRLLLPAGVRTLPADLAAALVLAAATTLAVFVPVVNETPLRVVLGLPYVLFLPGYVLIAALFPERASRRSSRTVSGATPMPMYLRKTDRASTVSSALRSPSGSVSRWFPSSASC